MARLVAVAEIGRPHGVKGEVRLRPFNVSSELFAPGRRFVGKRFASIPVVPGARAVAKKGAGKSRAAKAEAKVAKAAEKERRAAQKTLVDREGGDEVFVLTGLRPDKGGFVAKFAGISDRDQAEAIGNVVLHAPREEFPPLAEGEFYLCDIEGARAEFGGKEVGTVLSLRSYPTCEVLVVDVAGKELEVPFTSDYIEDLDVSHGLVKLSALPEGD